MTSEDIIRMAREADALGYVHDAGDEPRQWMFSVKQLERFAALVAAAEREACAKVCDDIFRHWLQTDPDEQFATPDADDCARAIRARGQA